MDLVEMTSDNEKLIDELLENRNLVDEILKNNEICSEVFDEKICEIASENRHLDCFIYADNNESPWDEDVYADNNGSPWDEDECPKDEMQDEMQDEEIPVDSNFCELCEEYYAYDEKFFTFNPCGHKSCWICYVFEIKKEKKCHVCRGEISSVLKI
jgi:hypothetical protein